MLPLGNPNFLTQLDQIVTITFNFRHFQGNSYHVKIECFYCLKCDIKRKSATFRQILWRHAIEQYMTNHFSVS